MDIKEDYATDAALFFVTTEEHHPRYDKRTRRWSCDCEDWLSNGDMFPCKHIERAKRMMYDGK